MSSSELSPPNALPMLHDSSYVWIDVREAHEWTHGHLPNCIHLPMSQLKPEDFARFSKEQKMIMVCRTGSRSGRITQALREMGYSNVFNLFGGMLGLNRVLPQPIPVYMY